MSIFKKVIASFCLVTCLLSCKEQIAIEQSMAKQEEHTGFVLLDNKQTNVSFVNKVVNTEKLNIFNYRNFYNGGGVAIGDINNDGLADVYFTANMGPNKLYLNQGDFVFKDITEQSGTACENNWSTGVVMVDINADGLLDIYVCNAGLNDDMSAGQENKLFINKGDNTFTEEAKVYGLNDNGYTTHTAFFDYDKDGDLDAYILNNSFIPVNTLNYSNKRELKAKDWPVKEFLKGGGDKLMRNDNGRFVDVTSKAGIYSSLIGFGLGVNVGDLNGDDYLDIYISNDFFEKDYIYINQKNGTFKEEIESRVNHLSMSSMGADIGDINNDGYPEIFTTDMLPFDDVRLKTTSSYDNIDVQKLRRKQGFYDQYMQNALQYNQGDGTFKEIANYSHVAASDWSWGALMFDADNDKYNDIFVCNGIYHDVIDQDFIDFFANELNQKMAMSGEKSNINEIIKNMPSHPVANAFFKNLGNLRFELRSESYGLGEKTFSNGAAYGDLDNDGDLDLVVNNVNQKAMIYKNKTVNHKSIKIKLVGNGKNTFAIGSKVKAYVGDQLISRELIPSRGFQSSVDYTLCLGVGQSQKVDSLHILWPNDKITIAYQLNVDTMYTFDISKAMSKKAFAIRNKVIDPLLKLRKHDIAKHIENDYLDFYFEPNIPFLQSRDGPAVCKGDVNGDGLDDIYMSGGKGHKSVLYLQSNGDFVPSKQTVFDRFAYFEDVAATFFDADGDKDLDLAVASGGNESNATDIEMLPRLFTNDGNGNFTLSNKLAKTNCNISTIIAHDFDGDGDEDLFFGSRSIPLQFGKTPDSYLMENVNGVFKIDQSEKSKALKNVGNVRDAVWVDINNDRKKELVIVGDWMAPKIFQFSNGKFTLMESGFEKKEGFYGSVYPIDIDHDGDNDLMLGNIGENFNLYADEKSPIKLFINDFDENGTVDKILTKSVNGQDKPVYFKREITQQLPGLKKKNLKHTEYATKSIQALFDAKTIEKCEVKYIREMRSMVAINDGKGKFILKPLPMEAQLSCINAITSMDLDNDGVEEIIIGGNNYNFSSNLTKLDGHDGLVLKNINGELNFWNKKDTGYAIKGEVRRIFPITIQDKKCIFTFLNNDVSILYQLNNQ